ncbi:MAG TPA: efflux RND transporter periplasmic adaptor subunit [Gemmataceae bacterium]|nr:efflux RND transporter periplasmic adaptor subunit [Gemmataceae bacterium]
MTNRALILTLLAAGCTHQSGSPPQQLPPPKVTVANPVRRPVSDYREYTGRIDAVQSVNVVARVRGFLQTVKFREGVEVKAGDLLYEIDPREFQAAVEQAQADVQRLQAVLAQTESELARANRLRGTGAITPEEVVQRQSARDIAQAQLKQAQAALENAQLQLSYTRIVAPIAGRIGRTFVTFGNLVGYGEPTLLTTIVSVDPMYVYFDAPESDYLEYRKLMQSEDLPPAEKQQTPLFVGLATEKAFPHKGTIDFRANTVDPGTGTIQIRGTLPNPDRSLVPGLYARVQVPFGKPEERLLLPQAAVQADQRGRFVLVVTGDNVVEYRPVTVGITTDDHMLVIEKGVTADDRVIVNGLQKARPGAPVQPVSDASQKRESS